jgi:hypothetical protein
VQYGRTLFRALLKISSKGEIEMISDYEIHPYSGNLPIASYDFDDSLNVGSLKLLVKLPYKATGKTIAHLLDASSLQDSLESANPADSALPPVTIGPGSEEGQTRRDGQTFLHSLHFYNVDFFGDVSFENATFRGNVRFTSCRFLGRVAFSNARINGSLEFRNCSIAGFPPIDGNVTPTPLRSIPDETGEFSIDLRSAVISRSLILERCDCGASVLLAHAHVEGKTRFVGCRIEPFFDTDLLGQGEKVPISRRFRPPARAAAALDFRYGRFDGGIDLAASYAQGSALPFQGLTTNTASRPTIVVGPIRGEQCVVKGSGVSLGGLIVCRLDQKFFLRLEPSWSIVTFERSVIEGGLRAWSPGENPLELFHHLRTVVHGDLNLTNVKIVGDVDVRGAWIGGDLDARNIDASGFISLDCLRQDMLDKMDDISQLDIPVVGRCELPVYSIDAPVFMPPADPASDASSAPRIARFGRTHVGGALNLTSAKCNAVYLNGCCVGGFVKCNDCEIDSITVGLSVSPIATSSDAAYWFAAHVPTEPEALVHKHFTAGSFGGYIADHSDCIGLLFAEHEQDSAFLVIAPEIRGFRMQNGRIHGNMIFNGLSISLNTPLDKTAIWEGKESIDHFFDSHASHVKKKLATFILRSQSGTREVPAIQIEDSVIQGRLVFGDPEFSRKWVMGHDQYTTQQLWAMLLGVSAPDSTDLFQRASNEDRRLIAKMDHLLSYTDRTFVFGNIRVENTGIGGQFMLSNLDVRGRFELRDVKVEGDVVLGWPRQYETTEKSSIATIVTTEASGLDLEMLRCEGDVLLYGLRLSGDLLARNIRVRGHFDLLRQIGLNGAELGRRATVPKERESHTCSAIVTGNIDLGGSELGWLQCISTCDSSASTVHSGNWCLEQTTVKRLTMFEPMPVQINIRSAEFAAIEIPSSTAGDQDQTSRTKLLDICKPRVEILALFEKLMRKEGQFDVANNIYAQHLSLVHRGWIGRLRGWFFKFFVWTWSPICCLVGLLAFFLLAMSVTSPEANWSADSSPAVTQSTSATSDKSSKTTPPKINSSATQSAPPNRDKDPKKDPQAQHVNFVWRAFVLAVPFVNLTSHTSGEDVKLRDTGSTQIGRFQVPIAPGSMGDLLSLAGWFLGSFLIVSLSGIAKRE